MRIAIRAKARVSGPSKDVLYLKLIELSAPGRKRAVLSSTITYNDSDFLFIVIDFLLSTSVDRLPIKPNNLSYAVIEFSQAYRLSYLSNYLDLVIL